MGKNPQQSQSIKVILKKHLSINTWSANIWPVNTCPIKHWPSLSAIGLLRIYQLLISPWLGNHCRFTPSCSCYAITAYRQYGFMKATLLVCRRLLKCNPWHCGGYDELPCEETVYPTTYPTIYPTTHSTSTRSTLYSRRQQ